MHSPVGFNSPCVGRDEGQVKVKVTHEGFARVLRA